MVWEQQWDKTGMSDRNDNRKFMMDFFKGYGTGYASDKHYDVHSLIT